MIMENVAECFKVAVPLIVILVGSAVCVTGVFSFSFRLIERFIDRIASSLNLCADFAAFCLQRNSLESRKNLIKDNELLRQTLEELAAEWRHRDAEIEGIRESAAHTARRLDRVNELLRDFLADVSSAYLGVSPTWRKVEQYVNSVYPPREPKKD